MNPRANDRELQNSQEGVGNRLRELEASLEELRSSIYRGEELLAQRIVELENELERQGSLTAELDRFEHVVARGARRVVRRLRNSVRSKTDGGKQTDRIPHPIIALPEDRRYATWVNCYDTMDDDVRAHLRSKLGRESNLPKFSIIVPVFNTHEQYLEEAIESVRAQIYVDWELCIVDDASTAPWVNKVLEKHSGQDPRIKIQRRDKNGHICVASNAALSMASGDWVVLFDHDDLLPEHALALCALAISRNPDACILYSDEDHIDEHGLRSSPYMKPEFDPVLLLGQNYLSHLCAFRRESVMEVGGFREGYEGSQDWDLVLRVSERIQPKQVIHVPHVLYHWREHPDSTASSLLAKPYAADAARRAVSDHLMRQNRSGRVVNIGGSGFNRVIWDVPDEPPRVSVIVLPRGGNSFMRCIDSIKIRSTYPNIEIVIVDDGGNRAPLQQFLADWGNQYTVVSETNDLTDSALLNVAARASAGDILCFVHEDIQVLTDTWLEEMVGLLVQPNVGIVGAKLLYDDLTIQHAGIVLGIGGGVGHVHRHFDSLEMGYFGRARLAQGFSAVSCACMAVRREVFEACGGFEEDHLGSVYGDVDFCLRAREQGWQTVWTPFAELMHHEAKHLDSVTLGENAIRFARDIRYLQKRWKEVMDSDPAYSPNLSLLHETWPLAWPPRVSYRPATGKVDGKDPVGRM